MQGGRNENSYEPGNFTEWVEVTGVVEEGEHHYYLVFATVPTILDNLADYLFFFLPLSPLSLHLLFFPLLLLLPTSFPLPLSIFFLLPLSLAQCPHLQVSKQLWESVCFEIMSLMCYLVCCAFVTTQCVCLCACVCVSNVTDMSNICIHTV